MSFNYKTRKNELKKIIASKSTRICFSAWVRKNFNKTVKCVFQWYFPLSFYTEPPSRSYNLSLSFSRSAFTYSFFVCSSLLKSILYFFGYVMRKLFDDFAFSLLARSFVRSFALNSLTQPIYVHSRRATYLIYSILLVDAVSFS